MGEYRAQLEIPSPKIKHPLPPRCVLTVHDSDKAAANDRDAEVLVDTGTPLSLVRWERKQI